MGTTRRELLLSTSALAGASLLPAGEALAQQSSDPLEEEVAAALNVWDFKKIAQQRLSADSWDFITGAAGDEITVRWNREAYDRIRLQPNALVNVAGVDTRTRLFGQEIPFPILVSPSGGHSRSHPDAELATARGAGQAQAIMTVSTLSSKPIEELAQVATQSLWFQLYMIRDRGLTREIVQRAEAAGCKAICITVDTPVIGARNREQRASRRRGRRSGPRTTPPTLDRIQAAPIRGRGDLQQYPGSHHHLEGNQLGALLCPGTRSHQGRAQPRRCPTGGSGRTLRNHRFQSRGKKSGHVACHH